MQLDVAVENNTLIVGLIRVFKSHVDLILLMKRRLTNILT